MDLCTGNLAGIMLKYESRKSDGCVVKDADALQNIAIMLEAL